MPKHSIAKSFVFAFKGMASALKERNFILHLVSATLVISAGFYFDVTGPEWCVLLICIGVVVMAELFNTAIEKLTDLVSPDFNPKAGEIKDIAAAAVLVFSIVSAIAGLIIFIPYLREMAF
jgi:diacylglycerol kinase (ATP)